MNWYSPGLWLLPLMPLFGAGLVLVVARRGAHRTLREPSPFPGLVAATTLLLTLAVAVWTTYTSPTASWSWWGPDLHPGLSVVGVARIMIVLVPLIAIPVVLYASSSMKDESGLPRLLALLVAFCGAMELLVLAGDILTLLVAWELVGATSWALIGYEWRDATRPRAALDAFITTRVGDLGLYLAAGALFAATGSLSFAAIAGLHGTALTVVAAGIFVAAAAKSAQLPFSPWLFSAMAGPTPASALLHSATMVAAGAYLLARLAPLLAAATWLSPAVAGLGLATAIAGGVVALLQTDLKRALAASTSAQYGLMLVAIGAGVPPAAAVHLVTHAAFKALLFLCAGVVLHSAGTLDLDRLRLGRALPRVARLFGVGTLALAAVPPLGGAFSKEQILVAASDGASGGTTLAFGVLLAGFLTAMYAGRLQLLAFGPGDGRASQRPSRTEIASIALLATVSVVLGLLWLPGGGRVAAWAAGGKLVKGTSQALAASLGTIVVAGLIDWILWRRGALFAFGMRDNTRDRVANWFGIPVLAHTLIVRPVLWLARLLAAFDQRGVDAGVRAAVRFTAVVSRGFAWRTEPGLDWITAAIVHATQRIAGTSSDIDDHRIDAGVEQIARGVGVIGADSRRLQTGLTHEYYTMVAVGVVLVMAVAALGRFTNLLVLGR